MNNSPILVTGSHRSGTTWVGKMLTFTDEVQYVYECFHPNGILRKKRIFDIWFKYLTTETEPFASELKRIFNYNYTFSEAYSLMDKDGKFNLRNTPVRIEFYQACKRIQRKGIAPIPLMKDPIAILSVPWLVKHFSIRPVILIRHPAAFVSSLVRLNWRFDFSNFLEQEPLMNDHLHTFADEMKSGYKDNPVKEAALLWNCLHHVIYSYKNSHKEWIFKRHEDLSSDPVREFNGLYDSLGLTFSTKIEQKITVFTSSENTGEVMNQKQIHQLQRDSRANIKNWKKRLSADQIAVIREMTAEIAVNFYSDEDW